MTEYEDQDSGEVISGIEIYGHLKSGTWEGTQKEDGTWVITNEKGNERTLIPIENGDSE